MLSNLHTHTYRCGHAVGTDREYIERAIEGGMKMIGFADHAPFVFPDGYQSPFRVPMDQAKGYISELQKLQEEYKDKIEIKIGFEMECYPLYFKDMLKTVCELGAEYLILGHHFLNNEHPDGEYISRGKHGESELHEYVDGVIEGISSGAFTYVAHPDIFGYSGDREFYKEEMRRLCKAAKKYEMPLEINFLGIRRGGHYPNPEFWEIAGQEGCSVVYGFDAHEPEMAYDIGSLQKAEELVTKNGLNLILMPQLKDPKKAL